MKNSSSTCHGTPLLTEEEIMGFSPDELCAAAWRLLPLEKQAKGLKGIDTGSPTFLGDEAELDEGIAMERVNGCARRIQQQLERSPALRDDDATPVTCAELRRLLFRELLAGLRPGGPAPSSPPSPLSATAAEAEAKPIAQRAAAVCTFAPVVKPDTLLLCADDDAVRADLMEDCVRERLRLASESQDYSVVHSVAELCNRAPSSPAAAQTLLCVLRQALQLSAQGGPSAPDVYGRYLSPVSVSGGAGGGGGGGMITHRASATANSSFCGAAPSAFPSASPPSMVSDFVYHVLLPVMHMIPLIPSWAPSEAGTRSYLAELGSLLLSAYAPPLVGCFRKRGGGRASSAEAPAPACGPSPSSVPASPAASAAPSVLEGATFTTVEPVSVAASLRPLQVVEDHMSERRARRVGARDLREPRSRSRGRHGGENNDNNDDDEDDDEENANNNNNNNNYDDEEYEDMEDFDLMDAHAVGEQLRETLRRMTGDGEAPDYTFSDMEDEENFDGNVMMQMLNSSLSAFGDLHARVLGTSALSALSPPIQQERYQIRSYPFLYATKVSVAVQRAERCDNVRVLIVPEPPASASLPPATAAATATTSNGSSSTSGTPLCVRPRKDETIEFEGPCRVLLVYLERDIYPAVFQAELRAVVSLPQLQWSREGEWAQALRHAQLDTASKLIAQLQVSAAAHDVGAALALQGGLRPCAPPTLGALGDADAGGTDTAAHDDGNRGGKAEDGEEELSPAVAESLRRLAALSDNTLRQQARCRAGDLPALRAVLGLVIRHSGDDGRPGPLLLDRPEWRSVVRRVEQSSAQLARVGSWPEVTDFLAKEVRSPVGSGEGALTPVQLADAFVAFLLTPNLPSVAELRRLLHDQASAAQDVVLASGLLRSACDPHCSALHHTLIALEAKKLLVRVSDAGHYATLFSCCGPAVVREMRLAFDSLSAALFSLLSARLRRQLVVASSPQRYLLQPWDYGPFTLLLLSLFAVHLDREDVTFIRNNVYTQLILLLPTFDYAARAGSLSVHGRVEEQSFANFFSAFFREPESGGDTKQQQQRTSRTSSGSAAAGGGALPVVVRQLDSARLESLRMAHTLQDVSNPDGFISQPGVKFAYSTAPVFAYKSNFSTELAVPQEVEVTVQHSRHDALYIGLSTPSLVLTAPDITSDPNGIYLLGSGALQHKGATLATLPAIRCGDAVRFVFEFDTAALDWRLQLLLNGHRVASLPVPRESLLLTVGYADGTNHGTGFKGFIADSSNSFAVRPTMYNISLYAELVLYGLILSCVNRGGSDTSAAAAAAGGGGRGLVPALSSAALPDAACALPSNSSASSHRKASGGVDPFTSFVDHCCTPLVRHIRLLLGSIRSVAEAAAVVSAPPTPLVVTGAGAGGMEASMTSVGSENSASAGSIADLTTAVKQGTALQLYNRFLMNFTLTLSAALRATTCTVDMLAAISDIVYTPGVRADVKCEALAAVCHLVSQPERVANMGVFDPAILWRACMGIVVSQARPRFRPYFATTSVQPAVLEVLENGRRVLYHNATRPRSTQRTTAYSAAGISFDHEAVAAAEGESDSGRRCPGDVKEDDVVRFSVRLQRGSRATELLGKHYYVGVACPAGGSAAATLARYPGERVGQPYVYCVSDSLELNERLGECVCAELERHRHNWLSSERNIVFGSGDVITVAVSLRQRIVVFYRNERPLGTLCKEVPPAVHVLFPFVELNNRDSSAKWLTPPSNLRIHASRTLRAMLHQWGDELAPRLREAIHDPDERRHTAALTICGSDGDEVSVVYRPPPTLTSGSGSGSSGGVEEVTILHISDRFALTQSRDGGLRRAALPALEPNNASAPPSIGMPLSELFSDLAAALLRRVGAGTRIERRDSYQCLRLLRLLAEATATATTADEGQLLAAGQGEENQGSGSGGAIDYTGPQTHELVHTVQRLMSLEWTGLPTDVLLRGAWNEITCAHEDVGEEGSEPLFIPPARRGNGEGDPAVVAEKEEEEEKVGADDHHAGVTELHCPTCGLMWRECEGDHAPPVSDCELCDMILRRAGEPSPYVAWLTAWRGTTVAYEEDEEEHDDGAREDGEEGNAGNDGDGERVEETEEIDLSEIAGAATESVPVFTNDRLVFSKDAETGAILVTGNSGRGLVTATGKLVSPSHYRGSFELQQYVEEAGAAAEEVGEEWACEACTLLNPADTNRCSVCYTPRPGTAWTCQLCQYALNSTADAICSMCGHLRSVNRMRQRSPGREKPSCFCTECHTKVSYNSFFDLNLRRRCATCKKVTQWLPSEKYKGSMEARLSGHGDEIEVTWVVDSLVRETTTLSAASFSFGQLAKAAALAHAKTTDETKGGDDDAASASAVTGDDASAQLGLLLRYYVPPVAPLFGAGAVLEETGGTERPTQPCVPAAISYYASLLLLRLAPRCDPGVFTRPDVLLSLRIADPAWLEVLTSTASPEALVGVARVCLGLLLGGRAVTPGTVHTMSTLVRAVMRAQEVAAAAAMRDTLLYGLCLVAVRHPKRVTVREAVCQSITELMEDSPTARLHARPLQLLLDMQPVVPGQRSVATYCLLQSVRTGPLMESALATTMAYMARSLQCMEAVPPQPLPQLLLEDCVSRLPYLVPLAETRFSEEGALIIGQVRGSMGTSPARGGCVYYEVVIPRDFPDDTSVVGVGWGTLQHERISSGHHVGADMYSWGFNCRDKIRILQEDQYVPVPRRVAAGDIVGTGMDLETMMCFWSLNGDVVSRVSVPSQGEGELIYPYVSGSVEPHGIRIALTQTVHRPDGYRDFCLPDGAELWERQCSPSAVAPQPYALYRSLCTFLEDLQLDEVPAASVEAVASALAEARYTEALEPYPALRALIDGVGGGDAARALFPYLRQLSNLSYITIMTAHYFPFVRRSAYFTQSYRKARDLLLPQARWILFETQVGGRPTYLPSPHKVLIDPAQAANLDDEAAATGAAGQGDDALLLRLRLSVTGQLFLQTEKADIFKNAVMFTVRLSNSVADDAGGVTRSVISTVAEELNERFVGGAHVDPLLPLLRLCGHSCMFTVVPNMERLFSSMKEDGEDSYYYRMLIWLGKMMGNITLCGTLKLPINFPRMVWKMLTYDTPTIEDYLNDVDDTVRGSLEESEFLLDDAFYYRIPGVAQLEAARSSTAPRTIHASASTSAAARVTPAMTPAISMQNLHGDEGVAAAADKEARRRRAVAEEGLVHQFDIAVLAIRRGLSSVIAESTLRTIRSDDLQVRVCGSLNTSADNLLSFFDTAKLPPALQENLAAVVRRFTNRQRSQFLLFCSGQSRLPLPERVFVACGDDTSLMPTAHTCSPTSLLLQPYRTAEELYEKLVVCLAHSQQFGFV